MKAREIMVQPVVTVRRGTSLEEAARLLLDHRFGCLPVVDEAGRLSGIVTESDFAAKDGGVPFSTLLLPQVFNQWMPPQGVERIYEAARTTAVEEIMSAEPATAAEETPVEDVIRLMLRDDINHVPVIRDGTPVGMITRHDLLRMMVAQADRAVTSRPCVCTVLEKPRSRWDARPPTRLGPRRPAGRRSAVSRATGS